MKIALTLVTLMAIGAQSQRSDVRDLFGRPIISGGVRTTTSTVERIPITTTIQEEPRVISRRTNIRVTPLQRAQPQPTRTQPSRLNQAPPPPAAVVNDAPEETGPPTPYSFQYESTDDDGTVHKREESGDENGVVTGSYSYRDADGVFRVVSYVADRSGYRASVQTNEPGTGKGPNDIDPASTTWQVEDPPAAVVDRYLRARSDRRGL